jgi:outer membrane receptor protein involved in Fe transport
MSVENRARRAIRAALLLGASSLAFSGAAVAQDEQKSFDVAPQPASSGIPEFAREANIQILVSEDDVAGKSTNAVHGTLNVHDAIGQLLAGTGISITSDDGHTIVLSGRSKNAGAASDGAASNEIVVVTAEKKTEDIKDAPLPVSVTNTQVLTQNAQYLLREYYVTIPGLNVTPNFSNDLNISIRGISTGGFSNPTVSILVDDVPIGIPTDISVPDIDPGDLERIEVLRGPQGTLYGASSMGGLIKYVTRDPSFDAFSGQVAAGIDGVYNGAGPGYVVRGSANVPLTDDLAVRVSGFERQDAGYITNLELGKPGANVASNWGFRAALLWQPIEDLSIKLNAIYQYTRQSGSSESDVEPGFGTYDQSYMPRVGGYYRTMQVYSAKVDYTLGDVAMTSITAFNLARQFNNLDYSYFLGGITDTGAPGIPGFGVTGAGYNDYSDERGFTHETRFSGTVWQDFDWLVGGYFGYTQTHKSDAFTAENPATGQILAHTLDFDDPKDTYQEYAGFGDLTWHVTDALDVQIGARESRIQRALYNSSVAGPFTALFYGQPGPIVSATERANATVFTYLFTPSYKIGQDLMVYARLASGYRPGGPNGPITDAPPQFEPDKTKNYEVGLKGDVFDHLISVDASVYYIDWTNIEIQLRNKFNVVYNGNGSGAKSEGFELSLESHPLEGLSLDGWFSYDNAVLTKPLVTDYGVPGNRLPDNSKYSASFSAEQDFPLNALDNSTGYVGAQVSYVGSRLGEFTPTPVRQYFPAYTRTDLKAGVHVNDWTVNFYANNVTNERGELNGGIGYLYPFAFVYIQPRTIGMTITRAF